MICFMTFASSVLVLLEEDVLLESLAEEVDELLEVDELVEFVEFVEFA
jgi:hypothetical protein